MMASGLIVPGTVIGYDDWGTGGPSGEHGAHKELEEKYGIKFMQVPHSRIGQPCYEVKAIRKPARAAIRRRAAEPRPRPPGLG
mmetsp:Transcript_2982/g.8850  ORF Transcript_2982/g.8850 Transcript_2982/m.8850 type:complete len:83 (+) Transcript_2982:2-250(+)